MSIYNISVSVGDSKHSNRIRREQLGKERFTDPAVIDPDDDKDGEYYVPSLFTGSKRITQEIDEVGLIVIDIDTSSRDAVMRTISLLKEDKIEYVVHTTTSHTPMNPRYRMLFNPSRVMTESEYRSVSRAVCERYNIKADSSSFKPAQLMFFPLVKKGREGQYKHGRSDGSKIDVDEMLLLVKEEERRSDESTLLPLAPPGGISQEVFLAAVCQARPARDCDYDGWAEMGMALWHQTDGADTGLNCWIRWSRENEEHHGVKITEEEMREDKWPSFNSKNRKGVTMRTILNKPKASGGRVIGATFAAIMSQVEDSKTLQAVAEDVRNDDFVGGNDLTMAARAYKETHNRLESEDITLGDAKFLLTDRPVSEEVSDQFFNRYAYDPAVDKYLNLHTKEEVSVSGMNYIHGHEMPLSANGTRKAVHETLSKGLNGFRKPRLLVDRVYRPGDAEVIDGPNGWILNTFDPRSWPDASAIFNPEADEIDREIRKMIETHMLLLASGRDDIAWYIQQHLGWLRQKPRERIHVAYAISSFIQGVGKSTLKELYATVLGVENTNTIYPKNVSEKFNSFSGAPKLMTFIEEFEFDSNRERNMAVKSLKELITSDQVAVRRMNRDVYMAPASTCYGIFSNDSKVIGHEGTGRRWMPIEVQVYSEAAMNEILGDNHKRFFNRYYELMSMYPDRFCKYFEEISLAGFDTDNITIVTEEKESYSSDNPVNATVQFIKDMMKSDADPDVLPGIALLPAIKKAIEKDAMLGGDSVLEWVGSMKATSMNGVCEAALQSMGYVRFSNMKSRRRVDFVSSDRPYLSSVWIRPDFIKPGNTSKLKEEIAKIRGRTAETVVPINDDIDMQSF